MREPTPRNSRLAIAASLAAIIALGGGGFLLGRQTAPQVPAVIMAPPPRPVPSPVVDAATATNVMGRADIIAVGNAAADAAASGTPVPGAGLDVTGKKFEVLLPFGCNGPVAADSNAPLRWNYDEATSTLRVHVEPTVWEPKTLWGDQIPAGVEALEGFWVAQPWSSRETCPAAGSAVAAPGMEAVTLPGQTLGMAQAFTANAPRRSQRQGKPYEAVVRIDREALDLSRGLQLKLTGRLDKYPDGAATRCIQPAGAEQRPICLVVVRIDEISIVNPAAPEAIVTWSVAQDVHSKP